MSTQQKIKKGIVDSLAYMISEDSRTSQTSLRLTALDSPALITYMTLISQFGADVPSLCTQQI